ncbi:MAG: hypothetical protein AB7U63_02230 [Porticoccaceae bacterium]
MTKDSGSKNTFGNRQGNRSRSFDSLFKHWPGIASQTFARAAEQSGNLLEKLLRAPEYMEQAGKAGRYLKDMRQVAGLTLEDLAKAVDIDNLDMLRAIEEGRSPVTLDILFRLASFYSRNDPLTFMMDFSKEYAPWLWQLLRFTGIERLVITLERELKFINIYRSKDGIRDLSNENFDRLIGFTDNAVAMAMEFIEPLQAQSQELARMQAEHTTVAKKPKPAARDTAAAKKPASPRKKPSTATKSATTAKTAKPRTSPKKTTDDKRASPKQTRGD